MTTITDLAETMQALLTTTADDLAKTGFIQRQRQVTGSGFVQALVFSFMANAEATRQEVNQTAANAGMAVSTPGLDKRFNAKAAYFLDSMLAEAVKQAVSAVPNTPSLLSRFAGVYVSDSTLVALPDALATVFQGANGAMDAAAKVAVQWDLNSGAMGVWLSAGRVHDQRTGPVGQVLPPGALRLNDLGFFNLATFAEDQARGVYFLSRYKVGTLVYTAEGQALELPRVLAQQQPQAMSMPIQLGARRLPCRLIALPVPSARVGQRRRRLRAEARRKQQPLSARSLALAAWTLYVTNLPPDLLSPQEAAILGSTRWQIESLFKLWKSQGRLATTRSQDPYRVWCEFYAKLLACVVQHWITIVGCGHRLDRSLHQATRLLRKRAFCLLEALRDLPHLIRCLTHTAALMVQTCRLSKRAAHPLTFQRWLEAAHA